MFVTAPARRVVIPVRERCQFSVRAGPPGEGWKASGPDAPGVRRELTAMQLSHSRHDASGCGHAQRPPILPKLGPVAKSRGIGPVRPQSVRRARVPSARRRNPSPSSG
ncbi:hypothetical protein GCM10022241_03720 [Micrococcus endophyticus]